LEGAERLFARSSNIKIVCIYLHESAAFDDL